MVSPIHAELRSESLQLSYSANALENDPVCFICTNHPLALNMIRNAIACDADCRVRIRTYSRDYKPVNDGGPEILILDTCSVPNWNTCFQEWQSEGGAIIGLVPSDPQSTDLELQVLHLGASGILRFNDKLPEQLLPAIHAVATGRVWVLREVVTAYVNWTRSALRRLSISDYRLTTREKEILDLVQRDLSNRLIAQKLAISERTAKFHVSNILRKLNLNSRRDLHTLSNCNVFSPFLNPEFSPVPKKAGMPEGNRGLGLRP
jgi:DNA-binding NarL/FixJ family response regulator